MLSRLAISSARASCSSASSRAFASTPRCSGGHGMNQPTGWLFGEKPLPKGVKRKRESWENGAWAMGAILVGYGVLFYYKGDQAETWARVEAKRRLMERGDFPDYTPTLPAGVNFNPPHPSSHWK